MGDWPCWTHTLELFYFISTNMMYLSRMFTDLPKSFVTSDQFPLQGCLSSTFLFEVGRNCVTYLADLDEYKFEEV